MQSLTSLAYITAGIILPMYYVPQVVRLLSDDSGLTSYSMSKSATQTSLRIIMMPFVVGVGNPTMTCIVALDLAGRLAELSAAVHSLRRQQQSWGSILRLCRPVALPRLRLKALGVKRKALTT